MRLPPPAPSAVVDSRLEPAVERIEILEAFMALPDVRRASGKRHDMALCLALFTLAVTAGNRGFLAIGDWLNSYRRELIALFKPPKQRLPSYSTLCRVPLKLDYSHYSAALVGKATQRPTLRWIFQCFMAVHYVTLNAVQQVVNLTDERRHILQFFGAPCWKYYLLC